jgi:hypothetical protein
VALSSPVAGALTFSPSLVRMVVPRYGARKLLLQEFQIFPSSQRSRKVRSLNEPLMNKVLTLGNPMALENAS